MFVFDELVFLSSFFTIRDDKNPPSQPVDSRRGGSSILKRELFAVSLVMHRAKLFGVVRKLLRNVWWCVRTTSPTHLIDYGSVRKTVIMFFVCGSSSSVNGRLRRSVLV